MSNELRQIFVVAAARYLWIVALMGVVWWLYSWENPWGVSPVVLSSLPIIFWLWSALHLVFLFGFVWLWALERTEPTTDTGGEK